MISYSEIIIRNLVSHDVVVSFIMIKINHEIIVQLLHPVVLVIFVTITLFVIIWYIM